MCLVVPRPEITHLTSFIKKKFFQVRSDRRGAAALIGIEFVKISQANIPEKEVPRSLQRTCPVQIERLFLPDKLSSSQQ